MGKAPIALGTSPSARRKPSGKAQARPRDSERTRARILEAAEQEFCEFGYLGARIDNIALRADANKRLIYAYVGSKEQLYLTILEQAYLRIRNGERALQLNELDPVRAMQTLVRFTFQHFQKHPSFIRLLIVENMNEARFLRRIEPIQAMHSPLVGQIRELLERGRISGQFRAGIDPVQLYISIAALGFFYLSNRHTLETIFATDLMAVDKLVDREEHIVSLIMDHLRSHNDTP